MINEQRAFEQRVAQHTRALQDQEDSVKAKLKQLNEVGHYQQQALELETVNEQLR